MKKEKDKKTRWTERRFHTLLVYVIFQSLVLIALFIAVVYKFADTASKL